MVLDTRSDGTQVYYGNGPGIDNKLWYEEGSAYPIFFLTDHLGSTRALVSHTGSIITGTLIDYDSFGVPSTQIPTRFQYAGREYDSDTQLYYYRARWYDPKARRFISEDPIGLNGGINLYGYVVNSPINLIDPFGQQSLDYGWSNYLRQKHLEEHGKYPLEVYEEIQRQSDLGGLIGAGIVITGGVGAVYGGPAIGALGTRIWPLILPTATRIPALGNKLDYFLGKAKGNIHNIQRSTDMLCQLNRIGIYDNAVGRKLLTEHLTNVLNNSQNIAQILSNGNVVRESLLSGPNGFLKFQTIWEGTKLITGVLLGKGN